MVANLRHHAADRGGAMFDLVEMRREREAAVSRGAALGSDTREIARGFHRQVDCSRQILQHAENILQQWREAEHP
jgi:hypothetical protein